MPANRNALIRYKTIDTCLKNRNRKWTLNDLIEACSDALYEYEGLDNGISKRTIQLDIQNMRSDKLGYNAPIIVKHRKYYSYKDPEYSITKIPISKQDLFLLKDVVSTLEQFKSFGHFFEFGGIVKRLEDELNVRTYKRNPIIAFDKNQNLKGLEYLDPCYAAISNRSCLFLEYQSFKARQVQNFVFHPQFLREFNNRWFLIGIKDKKSPILTLALDRILSLDRAEKENYIFKDLNPEEFYSDVIGVTLNPNQKPRTVKFFVHRSNAPYVKTKPFHKSQSIVEEQENGTVFTINVQLNFELERMLLGFGPSLRVIGPRKLRNRIAKMTGAAAAQYREE